MIKLYKTAVLKIIKIKLHFIKNGLCNKDALE